MHLRDLHTPAGQPIGATQIHDPVARRGPLHLGVVPRHDRIVNADVAGRITANGGMLGLECVALGPLLRVDRKDHVCGMGMREQDLLVLRQSLGRDVPALCLSRCELAERQFKVDNEDTIPRREQHRDVGLEPNIVDQSTVRTAQIGKLRPPPHPFDAGVMA